MGGQLLDGKVVSLLVQGALLSNVTTLAFALFSFVFEKIDATKKRRRRIRDEYRRAVQERVQKLWFKAYGYAFTQVYLRDTSIRPMPVHVILELARRDKNRQQLKETIEDIATTDDIAAPSIPEVCENQQTKEEEHRAPEDNQPIDS